MGIYHIEIINKGIKYGCSLFVGLVNGLALLGMSNDEWLKLLIVNCQTTHDPHKNDKSTNKQTKISSKQKNKDNLCMNNKVNHEADYFVAGPKIETYRATST